MRKLFIALVLMALCTAGVPAQPASESGGFKADVIANFDEAAEKVLALAEAIPQDKYGWAPNKEVRTASQVFMHIATGSYFLGSMAGQPRPEGTRDLEKESDKAKVIAALKDSFTYARKAIETTPDGDLGTTIDFFGSPTSKRSILIRIATHAHEHLGQAIAYVRSMGITPPWSKEGG